MRVPELDCPADLFARSTARSKDTKCDLGLGRKSHEHGYFGHLGRSLVLATRHLQAIRGSWQSKNYGQAS